MRVIGAFIAIALLGVGAWLFWSEQQPRDAEHTGGSKTDGRPKEPGLRGAEAGTRESASAELTDDARAYRACLAQPTPRGLARVVGRMLGPRGQEVAGASIAVHSHNPAGRATDSGHDGGLFVIEMDVPHEYQLVFMAPGYQPAVSAPRRYPGGKVTDIGTVTLEPGLSIRGRVFDKKGKAYADVSVYLQSDEDPLPAWWTPVTQSGGCFSVYTTTALDGSFEFHQLPPGPYRLHFDAPPVSDAAILDRVAAGSHAVRVVLPRQPPRDVETIPEWRVSLDLRTSDGGKVPEVSLACKGEFGVFAWDQQGAVIEVEVKGMGPVDLILTSLGVYRPVIVAQFARGEKRRTVVLERGLVLHAKIRGAPLAMLAGKRLELIGWLDRRGQLSPEPPPNDSIYTHILWDATIDERGAFRIVGLPPGRGHIELQTPALSLETSELVVPADKAPLTLTCRRHSAVDLVFRAAPGTRLGSLTWEIREHAAGGTRVADRSSAYEDPGTEYRTRFYRTDPNRRYSVHAQTFDPPTAEVIEVEIPQDGEEVIIQMRRPTVLTGRVVDTAGRAIPYALVKLHSAHGVLHDRELDLYADTDYVGDLPYRQARSDGRFEIAIPPTGTARLTAHHPGWCLRDAPAVVRAGQGDAVLVMKAGERITGRITAPTAMIGRGRFHSCDVGVWASKDGPVVHASVGPSGFFEVHGLPPGLYTLVVHNSRRGDTPGIARKTSVAAGTRGMEIQLQPALRTALDLRDDAGAPLADAVVYLRGPFFERRIEATRGKNPLFVCPGAPAGTLHFDITIHGTDTYWVNVKAGTTTRYVVR